MTANVPKLVVIGVLALALIVVVAVQPDAAAWAVPLLTLLVGYVVGNARVTERVGATSPIIDRVG